jgi:hypothetical protein
VHFKVWEEGFESNNNSNEMVARIVVITITKIARIVKAINVGKMVKPQYEATTNISLLVAFVAFVAFSSYQTTNRE